MTDHPPRCRIVACNEPQQDGRDWSLYLINDDEVPLDRVELLQVGREWGEIGHVEDTALSLPGLPPGAWGLLWRNDGELRVDLMLSVDCRGRSHRLDAAFPKLYKLRDLPVVEPIGRPGWTVLPESPA